MLFHVLLGSLQDCLRAAASVGLQGDLHGRVCTVLLRLRNGKKRERRSKSILGHVRRSIEIISSTFVVSLPGLMKATLRFITTAIFVLVLSVELSVVVLVVIPTKLMTNGCVAEHVHGLALSVEHDSSRIRSRVRRDIRRISLLRSLRCASADTSALSSLRDGLCNGRLQHAGFDIVSQVFVSLTVRTNCLLTFF